jgi:phage baseplate assembly protein W
MAVLKGLSFPFRVSGISYPAVSQGSDIVRQSLINILSTEQGEREMQPDYGVRFMSKLFENNTTVLQNTIKFEVSFAIRKWEPRAILEEVLVEKDQEQGLLRLDIRYKDTTTVQVQQLKLDIEIPLGG